MKYDDDITWIRYKNFKPTSTSDLNSANMQTTFNIDLPDSFIAKNIQYYITGKFKSTNNQNPYAKEDSVRLVNNFVAHLLFKIEVKKHDTVIDYI